MSFEQVLSDSKLPSMLHEQIRNEMKVALKAKDTIRLETLRGLITAFMNELVSRERKPQDILSDDEVLSVIQKAAKQRKDSIAHFEKGNRQELAQKEKEELSILETYLPKEVSATEIEKFLIQKKKELNINDVKQSGILIGALMKELKGRASGDSVKKAVEKSFSQGG